MDIFHSGEIEAQRRAETRLLAEKVGRIIGPTIPDAAAAFLAQRTFVVSSTTGSDGAVHASILTGAAGFAESVDESTIVLRPVAGDLETVPHDLEQKGSIGLLAIDFRTRRRIRINGTAVARGEEVVISTREVYSNCPQYIHPQSAAAVWNDGMPAGRGDLDVRQIDRVAAADAFFLASSNPGSGSDVSHRGGEPGFIVATQGTVAWHDFPGNNMFNTLGNLLLNDRCSLLFVDFASGDRLRIDGRASVEWSDPRRIEVAIESVVERRGR